MNTQKLRYILAVNEYKNFSKASENMYVSQPYLSKLIANTEKELGFNIFQRKGKEMALTKKGEVYLKYIQKVIDLEKDMNDEINALDKKIIKKINIGMRYAYSTKVSAKAIQEFSLKYSDVKLKFKNFTNDKVTELLKNGEIDMALYTSPIILEDFDFQELYTETLYIIAKKSDKIDLSKLEKVKDRVYIADENIINKLLKDIFITLDENIGLGIYGSKLLYAYGINPKTIDRVENVETAYQLAKSGYGATLLSSVFLNRDNDSDIIFYQIGEKALVRSVKLIYNKGKNLTKSEEYLIKILRDLL